MKRIYLETRASATLNNVRKIRHQIEKVTAITGLDRGRRSSMALCYSEAAANAVKHANEPKATEIAVRFGLNLNQWVLEISDNGSAFDITTEHQRTVFDEQQSLESSGRGLSLIKSACDSLSYRRDDEQGINTLTLAWERPSDSGKVHVAVIEDSSSLRQLYHAFLAEDYTVTTYSNGLDALKGLRDNPVDLVLSDIDMPDLDGIALREHLLVDEKSELTPFVYLTATNDPELVEKATEMGIDDYLKKPVSQDDIRQTIDRVIKRSRQVRARLTERIDLRITRALYPQLPTELPGWKLASASRNTGSGGGDLLLHHRKGNSSSLILADIMGHDDSAKFFAHAWVGYIRGMLQANADNMHPDELLKNLSRCAYDDDLMQLSTLTCLGVHLDDQQTVSLASAGHPEPWLIRQGRIETVPVKGMLPGLLDDTVYEATKLKLAEQERLVIFTDGLFESADTAEGREHLLSAMRSVFINSIDDPIEHALSRVMNTFDELTSGRALDDTSVLMIEAGP